VNPAAPSRAAMHDLIVPPAIAFWPATPAWAVLFALLALLLTCAGWRAWRRWRRNAYRREALRELTAASPPRIAAILKRAALVAWPRAQVAGLAGADWAAFLRRTAPRARLDEATALGLADLAYGSGMREAREAAARWIRCHDPRR
jgi:hypothetical protein